MRLADGRPAEDLGWIDRVVQRAQRIELARSTSRALMFDSLDFSELEEDTARIAMERAAADDRMDAIGYMMDWLGKL